MGALSFAFVAVMFGLRLGQYPNINVEGLTLQDAYEFRQLYPENVTNYMLAFGRKHIDHHSDYILQTYGAIPHIGWIGQASNCVSAWDAMSDLWHQDQTSPWFTLHYLHRLRSMIGEDAYNARQMPQPCPGWMFTD